MLALCCFLITFPFGLTIFVRGCLKFSHFPGVAPQRSENIFIWYFLIELIRCCNVMVEQLVLFHFFGWKANFHNFHICRFKKYLFLGHLQMWKLWKFAFQPKKWNKTTFSPLKLQQRSSSIKKYQIKIFSDRCGATPGKLENFRQPLTKIVRSNGNVIKKRHSANIYPALFSPSNCEIDRNWTWARRSWVLGCSGS